MNKKKNILPNTKKDYSPHFRYLDKKKLEEKAIYSKKNYKNVKISPLSGSEPKYEPDKWNKNYNIKNNHNCYSYAVDQRESRRKGKAQPGYYSGYDREMIYNCNSFYKRLSGDFPGVYLSSFEGKCEKGFHKSFLVYSEGDDIDYHFYRQDNKGLWSHKPGRTEVTNKDASGNKIINPLHANRNYGHLNYKTPCFFFCVNKNLGHTHSKNIKKSFFNFNF